MIAIRPLTRHDLASVAAIEAAVQASPWKDSQFATSLDDGHRGWVAVEGEEVLGFAIVMQVLDEASLLNLGVAAAHQRRGIGRRLVEFVIEDATENGAAVMQLEVRISNQAAKSLYRRLGFIEVGQRRGYYRTAQGREDALLMSAVLDAGGR
ncbi:ribosomal protein S18-alanine N-acetyltransferase [Chitinimonas lacunae]|uniref:[Ribosomal protein bS18]-alanine N-acetyltransferase n=1 Tax=Chitinimonas lacunae TaxID=1963018 RepID=A0ABV8MNF2_9NEIS